MKRGLIKNKNGMEMAINTIVVLVIAIMVLIFLVLFFTDAGKNFMEKIGVYQGATNVDAVIDNCNFYVDTEAKYSYCCEKRDVTYLDELGKEAEAKLTCLEVSDRFGNVDGMNCGGITC